MLTDYYRVLGVKKDADADEIKKAFRALAKKYHPDATGGDKQAERRFLDINEAYETLGDPQKRRAYDAQATAPPGGRAWSGGGPFARGAHDAYADRGGGFDIDDLLGDLFGGAAARARPRQALDIRAACNITPWLAALGGRIEVRVGGKTLSVKVPPNAKSGQKLRLRGQGHAGSGTNGDLILEITIQNPAVLTKEMRGLYERMAALGG